MPVGVVMRDGKVRSSTGQHLNVAGTKGAWRPYIGLKVEFDLVPGKVGPCAENVTIVK